MFEGSKIIAASLASALHPLSYKNFTHSAQIEIYKLRNTIHTLWCTVKKGKHTILEGESLKFSEEKFQWNCFKQQPLANIKKQHPTITYFHDNILHTAEAFLQG